MQLETMLNSVMATLLNEKIKSANPEYDDEFETYYLAWNMGKENYVNLTISSDGVFYYSGLKCSGLWYYKDPIPTALLEMIK